MAVLDAVSLTIMFGALLVLAGILSSLVALRFGAPLLPLVKSRNASRRSPVRGTPNGAARALFRPSWREPE